MMETDPLTHKGFLNYSVAFWTFHASWILMFAYKSISPLITLVLSLAWFITMCVKHPNTLFELERREEEIRRNQHGEVTGL